MKRKTHNILANSTSNLFSWSHFHCILFPAYFSVSFYQLLLSLSLYTQLLVYHTLCIRILSLKFSLAIFHLPKNCLIKAHVKSLQHSFSLCNSANTHTCYIFYIKHLLQTKSHIHTHTHAHIKTYIAHLPKYIYERKKK